MSVKLLTDIRTNHCHVFFFYHNYIYNKEHIYNIYFIYIIVYAFYIIIYYMMIAHIVHIAYYLIVSQFKSIRNQYELFTRIRSSTIILFYAKENYFQFNYADQR